MPVSNKCKHLHRIYAHAVGLGATLFKNTGLSLQSHTCWKITVCGYLKGRQADLRVDATRAIKQHSTHSLLGLNCSFHTAYWAMDQKQRLAPLIKNIQTESRGPCSAIALLSIGREQTLQGLPLPAVGLASVGSTPTLASLQGSRAHTQNQWRLSPLDSGDS